MSEVRIGLIGCGGMARAHLRQLSRIEDARVVALADPDASQIEKCRQAFPGLADARDYADWREMLEREDLEAVEVGTPHSQHAEQTLAAFERGLHVLCEKPLVTSLDDADRVIEARDRSGKVGLLSYQRHYSPLFRRLRAELASKRFGEITFVSALLGQQWKTLTAGSWRQDPMISGGGQLNDSGSHIVDVLLWATQLRPASVAALCDNRGAPVDIDSAVTVRFESGAFGSINVLGDFPIWHESWTFGCERGGFLLQDDRLTLLDADGRREEQQDEGPDTAQNPDQNFIGAILRGEPVESTFENGREVLRLTVAAWRSAANGGAPVALKH
jgi:predicted dehydrogenase